MTQRTQPTSCRASFLRVAGLRHHVTARDENGNLPFPYTWCPNPQWESDAYGTAISVSGHSWFLDGRWTRGSPSASYLLMHCGTYGVSKCRIRLSDFTFTFHFHALEKEMATHSTVLAWRIPGTGDPGGLLSMGSHRVGHD